MSFDLFGLGVPRRGAPSGVGLSTLSGDWTDGVNRFRINADGSFSRVTVEPYVLSDGQTLTFQGETFLRQAGITGLRGVWRIQYGDGSYLDFTFGAYAFYSYLWSDGDSGGGCYEDAGGTLAIVETRARIQVMGDVIQFNGMDGTLLERDPFKLTGDHLEITTSNGTLTWTRLPL